MFPFKPEHRAADPHDQLKVLASLSDAGLPVPTSATLHVWNRAQAKFADMASSPSPLTPGSEEQQSHVLTKIRKDAAVSWASCFELEPSRRLLPPQLFQKLTREDRSDSDKLGEGCLGPYDMSSRSRMRPDVWVVVSVGVLPYGSPRPEPTIVPAFAGQPSFD
jgi:hypothetical protein